VLEELEEWEKKTWSEVENGERNGGGLMNILERSYGVDGIVGELVGRIIVRRGINEDCVELPGCTDDRNACCGVSDIVIHQFAS